MNLIPTNGYVLCEKINKEKEQINSNGFIYEKENVAIYKIIKCSSSLHDNEFIEGDTLITNSIPTKVQVDDKLFYLINIDNIAAKIS